MNNSFYTDRLTLNPLAASDAAFIFELVNTPGWIEFIGDRNIHSIADSENYIQKILNSSNIVYWTVRLKEDQTSIGVVTFIKRNYLAHHDIGFAFLPQYAKKGYAYEASKIILDNALANPSYLAILATTIPTNKNSIQLLEKLGLGYEKELTIENNKLLIYSTAKK